MLTSINSYLAYEETHTLNKVVINHVRETSDRFLLYSHSWRDKFEVSKTLVSKIPIYSVVSLVLKIITSPFEIPKTVVSSIVFHDDDILDTIDGKKLTIPMSGSTYTKLAALIREVVTLNYQRMKYIENKMFESGMNAIDPTEECERLLKEYEDILLCCKEGWTQF